MEEIQGHLIGQPIFLVLGVVRATIKLELAHVNVCLYQCYVLL